MEKFDQLMNNLLDNLSEAELLALVCYILYTEDQLGRLKKENNNATSS